MAGPAFNTFAVADEADAGCRIEISCDASLEDYPILRTDIGDAPSMGPAVEYFLGLESRQAEIVVDALKMLYERNEKDYALTGMRSWDSDEIIGLLGSARRLKDYFAVPPRVSPAPLSRDEALVAHAVKLAKLQILEDVRSGRVPADVRTFGDLHDHVDANEYGGLCDESLFADVDEDIVNAVQDTLNAWIAGGGLQEEVA